MLNDMSYGIKIWTDLSSVLSQSTRLTDGQTERFLIARPRLHFMQRGRNVFSVAYNIISYLSCRCINYLHTPADDK